MIISSGFALMDRVIPPVLPLPASVLGYYYGPGFTDHGINGNDATQVGTVPQPAGGPIGANWLASGTLVDTTDYIQMPDILNGLTHGVIEFTYNQTSVSQDLGIFGASVGFFPSNDILYIVATAGTLYVQQVVAGGGGGGINMTWPNTLTGIHTLRIELSSTVASDNRLYIDNVLQVTSSTAWVVPTYNKTLLGNVFSNPGAFPWTNYGVDGFMISNNINEAYPPV